MPGKTELGIGQSLVWTPPALSAGDCTAFSVKASDEDGLVSATAVAVVIHLPTGDEPPTAEWVSGAITDVDCTFNITYTDDIGVKVSTLDDSDIRVTGPRGFNQLATLVGVDNITDGTPRTAIYRIVAPGGAWDTVHSGTYTVSVEPGQVADTSGNPVSAGSLGDYLAVLTPPPITVDYLEMPNLDLSAGELWYAVETVHGATLTLQTYSGGARITLFDASLNELTSSASKSGAQRLDYPALAGEVFVFRVAGPGSDVDLQIANLMEKTGTSVIIHGTAEDDQLTFDATTAHRITIHGVDYAFTAAEANSFSFDGLAGNDDVCVVGSAEPDNATLQPTSGTFTGPGYFFTATHIDSIGYDGGNGDDTVWIWGSKASNTYEARPGSAEMTGGGVSITAKAERIYGRGGGGADTATIWDSPGNDLFEFFPIWARVNGDGYFHNLQGFTTMIGKAELGVNGTDEVFFRGSPQGDWLKSTAITTRMLTLGAWRHAEGFDTITAYSRGGKNKPDTLLLQDTPGEDMLRLKPLETVLGSPDYDVTAYGFGTVEATRVNLNSAEDKVALEDSSGDDTFVGNPAWIQVSSPSPAYSNKATGFPSVMAYSTGAGLDRAFFYDFNGPSDARAENDTFTTLIATGELAGPGYRLWARFFDEVHAETKLGRDVANFTGTAGIDELTATATDASFSVTNTKGKFTSFAKNFHEINASAGDGVDKAAITDAAVDLTTYGPPEGVNLDSLTQILWLSQFEKIQRPDTGGSKPDIENIDAVFAWWE